MTRFEKLCWYWMRENEYLFKNTNKIIKFEELITNYNYFKKNLLDPLNLEVSQEIWEREKAKPKNITKKYKIPHWKQWDNEMINTFNEICSDTMFKMGYE
jgi:hypothetical protein